MTQTLTDALKRYFDKMSPMSKRVKYCAVALVGFDAAFYPTIRSKPSRTSLRKLRGSNSKNGAQQSESA